MSEANFVANGTINPSVFVVIDATQGQNRVIQASAATTPLAGISQEGGTYAPIPGQSNVAALAGDPVKVYQTDEVCFLQATSAGWTAGDLLTANSSGLGVTASSTNQVGAQALTTVSAAGYGWVKVINRTK